MGIEANLRADIGDRKPTARYTSFDYCFNHFQALRESGFAGIGSPAGMELASLHLGFYLASWGMLRGSAAVSRRSVKVFEPVVAAIASMNPMIWGIDADAFDDRGIDAIIRAADALSEVLPPRSSDILVTKIMLGVFGCVPAFDMYFKNGLGLPGSVGSPFTRSAPSTLRTPKSLNDIASRRWTTPLVPPPVTDIPKRR